MSPRSIEPLDPATWFARIAVLIETAEKIDGQAPDVSIRQAFHLIALAPGPLRDMFPLRLDEHALEALLECGAYDSAVIALIGQNVNYKIDRRFQHDTLEARVALEGTSVRRIGRHNTLALGLLKAWAQAVMQLATCARKLTPRNRAQRKSLVELPPNSTEH